MFVKKNFVFLDFYFYLLFIIYIYIHHKWHCRWLLFANEKDTELKKYEIGVDTAQVAFGVNDKADEISKFAKDINSLDMGIQRLKK